MNLVCIIGFIQIKEENRGTYCIKTVRALCQMYVCQHMYTFAGLRTSILTYGRSDWLARQVEVLDRLESGEAAIGLDLLCAFRHV